MRFEQFAARVADEVRIHACADIIPVEYGADGRSWKRRAFTVTVSEHGSAAIVSYVKVPTESLGHSSNAFPFEISDEGARRAAAFIVDRLSDPYCY